VEEPRRIEALKNLRFVKVDSGRDFVVALTDDGKYI